jgi:hypothetical protein
MKHQLRVRFCGWPHVRSCGARAALCPAQAETPALFPTGPSHVPALAKDASSKLAAAQPAPQSAYSSAFAANAPDEQQPFSPAPALGGPTAVGVAATPVTAFDHADSARDESAVDVSASAGPALSKPPASEPAHRGLLGAWLFQKHSTPAQPVSGPERSYGIASTSAATPAQARGRGPSLPGSASDGTDALLLPAASAAAAAGTGARAPGTPALVSGPGPPAAALAATADACLQTDAALLAPLLLREPPGPTMPLRWRKGEVIGAGSFGQVKQVLPRWLLLASAPLTHAWQRA